MLYFISNVYGSSALVYGYYIATFSLRFYYNFMFYSLEHGRTVVMSYCHSVRSDTIVALEWSFVKTIVQSVITIVGP